MVTPSTANKKVVIKIFIKVITLFNMFQCLFCSCMLHDRERTTQKAKKTTQFPLKNHKKSETLRKRRKIRKKRRTK